MIVRPYQGKKPRVGERVFIAENAVVIGDVEIGDDSSIWYGTVVRGDVFHIRIGARTNIQDNCTLHVTTDTWPVIIEDDVTIGHGVIAHGCTIRRGSLVGMGSRVLDGAEIGEEALVGAGALVTEGMKIPPRTLAIGFPAKVKRELTAEELERLRTSAPGYVRYKDIYLAPHKAPKVGFN